MGRLFKAFQDIGMYDEAQKIGQEAVERMESSLASLNVLASNP